MSKKEITEQTAKEILSKWASLAKFIEHYEALEWDEAKKKALAFFKDKKKAVAYIDGKRGNGFFPIEPKETVPETLPAKIEDAKSVKEIDAIITKKKKKKSKAPVKRDIFSLNYRRLLIIAPQLEQRLLNSEEVYGKSKVAGFMDFNLEWVWTEEEGVYHLAMSHYYKQNGDLVADPDMRILVDINKEYVRALTYQDSLGYQEVYLDIFERNRINLKLSSSLNKFLGTWLINLFNQNHQVEWKHDEIEAKTPKLKVVKEPISEKEVEKPSEPTKKEKVKDLKRLFGNIYNKLEILLPDLAKKLKKNEVDGLLTNGQDFTYDLVPAEPLNKTTLLFGINQNENKGISLILSVNVRAKRAWLTYSDPDFVDEHIYTHDSSDIFSEPVESANLLLLNWIMNLIKYKYKVEWNEEDKIAPNSPQIEGQVQLTDRHIKAGFKQKHINWINKHRKGLLLVPRTKKLINNTQSFEADLSKKAMKAGKRISRTGVIYYEGRSNRADLTGSGL